MLESFSIKIKQTSFFDSFTIDFQEFRTLMRTDAKLSKAAVSDKQLKTMLHFLENKGGYRRFKHQIPSVYNRPKVYYSPKWTHTWNYANSNTLSVELKEDPMGVIPTGT